MGTARKFVGKNTAVEVRGEKVEWNMKARMVSQSLVAFRAMLLSSVPCPWMPPKSLL